MRPHSYTPEIGNELLRRFASGETIKHICEDDSMPSRSTIYEWIADKDREDLREFHKRYEIAKKAHALALADDVIDIADDTSNDTIVKTSRGGDEYEVPNNEWIARSRLRVETRLKLMGKRAPDLFGEQLQIGGNGGGPIEINDVTDRNILRRIAFALAMGLKAQQEPPQQARVIEDHSNEA